MKTIFLVLAIGVLTTRGKRRAETCRTHAGTLPLKGSKIGGAGPGHYNV